MLVDLTFINEPGTEFASPIHFKTSLTTGPPRAQTSMLFAGLSSFSQWFRVSDNTHHVGSRTAHIVVTVFMWLPPNCELAP